MKITQGDNFNSALSGGKYAHELAPFQDILLSSGTYTEAYSRIHNNHALDPTTIKSHTRMIEAHDGDLFATLKKIMLSKNMITPNHFLLQPLLYEIFILPPSTVDIVFSRLLKETPFAATHMTLDMFDTKSIALLAASGAMPAHGTILLPLVYLYIFFVIYYINK